MPTPIVDPVAVHADAPFLDTVGLGTGLPQLVRTTSASLSFHIRTQGGVPGKLRRLRPTGRPLGMPLGDGRTIFQTTRAWSHCAEPHAISSTLNDL